MRCVPFHPLARPPAGPRGFSRSHARSASCAPHAAKTFSLCVIAASLTLGSPLLAVAQAAKSGKSGQSTQAAPLSLISEYTSLNPNDPPWCLSEDDIHIREWSGSLDGSFSATERLCEESVDYYDGMWWSGGGVGFQTEAYVVGALNDLAITSPLGDSHQAVLVGSSTAKGVTTYHYEACYVTSRSISTGTGGAALPGGTWTMTLSGAITRTTFYVHALMPYVSYQQEHCPASEQNLTP